MINHRFKQGVSLTLWGGAVKGKYMVEAWAEPCPDPENVRNTVHAWVTQKAEPRRSKTIPMKLLELRDTICRERMLAPREVDDALWSLIHTDCIEETDKGFLVRKKFPGKFRSPDSRRGEPDSLVAERLDFRDTGFLPEASEASRTSTATSGVKQESAQNYVAPPARIFPPRVELCRDFFPNLVEDHGLETIPRHLYQKALFNNVKRLEFEYRLSLPFIRRMMEEFVQHPDWCRRSSRPAWLVFISRWQQLVKLVHAQQHRDPTNRRHNPDWLGKYA